MAGVSTKVETTFAEHEALVDTLADALAALLVEDLIERLKNDA
jgi:hypothetical protein